MLGLAQMAWRLACARHYADPNRIPIGWLVPRWIARLSLSESSPPMETANTRYYRIIDRITRGEKP